MSLNPFPSASGNPWYMLSKCKTTWKIKVAVHKGFFVRCVYFSIPNFLNILRYQSDHYISDTGFWSLTSPDIKVRRESITSEVDKLSSRSRVIPTKIILIKTTSKNWWVKRSLSIDENHTCCTCPRPNRGSTDRRSIRQSSGNSIWHNENPILPYDMSLRERQNDHIWYLFIWYNHLQSNRNII